MNILKNYNFKPGHYISLTITLIMFALMFTKGNIEGMDSYGIDLGSITIKAIWIIRIFIAGILFAIVKSAKVK